MKNVCGMWASELWRVPLNLGVAVERAQDAVHPGELVGDGVGRAVELGEPDGQTEALDLAQPVVDGSCVEPRRVAVVDVEAQEVEVAARAVAKELSEPVVGPHSIRRVASCAVRVV